MTGPILRVAVPSPLPEALDYLPPEGLDPAGLSPGIRLRVPLGRSHKVGVLLETRRESDLPAARLRRVLAVLDDAPLLSSELLDLARWASGYYHHPPGEVFAALLPVLLRQGLPAQPAGMTVWCATDEGRMALMRGQIGRAPRQRQVLQALAARPQGLSDEGLRRELAVDGAVLARLRDKGWLRAETRPVWPAAAEAGAAAPELSPDQDRAVKVVGDKLDDFGAFLLHGVTGSGKTEVYIRLMEQVLSQGRQALVLVPEIGLTPQLLDRLASRLPYPLVALHSGLSDRERLNAWLAARSGQAAIVVGTRSAVFTPLPRLGVVLVDEEHDGSFKQQEGFRYHARDLAVVRARALGVPVLLGSATPALESLYNVRRGRYRELSLPARVGGAVAPDLELLDVRRRPMEEGLSEPLLGRMQVHLARGEQVLLFLNRRGFAPTLICHECGWLCQCRRCDARLTLHLRRNRLICHHCGAEQVLMASCPDCGSVDLRALGAGTERLEQVLKRRFPDQGIARIDRDSTRRKGSLDALLDDIHADRRRILLGTQMLAKGHHFPQVTLVGIVDADQGLFGADYRSAERMAQTIIQVAGRAGRAEKPGRVAIQTHHPNHPLLQTLVREGYTAFADATLEERRLAGLPPFGYQALLRAEALEPAPPQAFLEEAAERGSGLAQGVELLGPVPAPMERRAGRYRAQLLVQAADRRVLHGFLDAWMRALANLKSGRRVRWSLDVDPLDLL